MAFDLYSIFHMFSDRLRKGCTDKIRFLLCFLSLSSLDFIVDLIVPDQIRHQMRYVFREIVLIINQCTHSIYFEKLTTMSRIQDEYVIEDASILF
jgi:hypothetical protein